MQCIVNGKENPQNCPFPLGLLHSAGGGPTHTHTHRRAHYNTSQLIVINVQFVPGVRKLINLFSVVVRLNCRYD